MGVGQDMAHQQLSSDPFRTAGGKTTFLGTLSSVGAVLAACSCCILPMALAGIGVSTGLGSALSPLGPFRWPLTAVSAVLVMLSWLLVIRQRRHAGSYSGSKLRSWLLTPRMLALSFATLTTLVAVFWSAFEPGVMRAML